eukprot:TRINITY_DN14021_c0_g1_i1.p1 TRINITY_DN14021_c0_g1~~TRINITY_DN14021_c0_g1_i1.p1  ORF type:complete len:447 (-),score=98.73 TRINITY_DN14021_c0_g1_i1:94-1434(-)
MVPAARKSSPKVDSRSQADSAKRIPTQLLDLPRTSKVSFGLATLIVSSSSLPAIMEDNRILIQLFPGSLDFVTVPPVHEALIKAKTGNYRKIKYDLQGVLGSGEESTVYRACVYGQNHQKFSIAVKRIKDSLYKLPAFVPPCFKGEMLVAREMRDNLLINSCIADTVTPYGVDLLFPHVMDGNMQDVAQHLSTIRNKETARNNLIHALVPPLVVLCSRGLKLLAEKDIRHGNLKLSDMLFSLKTSLDSTSFNRFKLSDFGHSYMLKDEFKKVDDVNKGSGGSGEYCHPNADVFSLGMAVYQLAGVTLADAAGKRRPGKPTLSWKSKMMLDSKFPWLPAMVKKTPDAREMPHEPTCFPGYESRGDQDVINELCAVISFVQEASKSDAAMDLSQEGLKTAISSMMALIPDLALDPFCVELLSEPREFVLDPPKPVYVPDPDWKPQEEH